MIKNWDHLPSPNPPKGIHYGSNLVIVSRPLAAPFTRDVLKPPAVFMGALNVTSIYADPMFPIERPEKNPKRLNQQPVVDPRSRKIFVLCDRFALPVFFFSAQRWWRKDWDFPTQRCWESQNLSMIMARPNFNNRQGQLRGGGGWCIWEIPGPHFWWFSSYSSWWLNQPMWKK